MRVDRDLPIPMDDGIVLRADVFLPEDDGTFPVGVLIPDIPNPLFPPIVRGIEIALAIAAGVLTGTLSASSA